MNDNTSFSKYKFKYLTRRKFRKPMQKLILTKLTGTILYNAKWKSKIGKLDTPQPHFPTLNLILSKRDDEQLLTPVQKHRSNIISTSRFLF